MQSLEHGRWLNEPQTADASESELCVVTDARTDFWRETHYGFVRDNGHFYMYQTEGDFTEVARFVCGFRSEAGRHSDQLPATVPI